MILLLGGTTETAPVAEALAQAGRRVLVSTATDMEFNAGRHANIARRCGRLDTAAMIDLVQTQGVRVLVDVSHPYAVQLRATAKRVANKTGIPYLTFVRPRARITQEGVQVLASHAQAARAACGRGRPVLLTVGSRNVAVYAREAAHRGVPIFARVLPNGESVAACRSAGIPREHVVTGMGPFSVEENRTLIRRVNAGVLVTKNSGEAGGFQEKQEATRQEGCILIVVDRIRQKAKDVFPDTNALIRAVLALQESPE